MAAAAPAASVLGSLPSMAGEAALIMAAATALDAGINKGIPAALRGGRKFTKKHNLKTASKVISKIEGAYNSKGGQLARNAATLIGTLGAAGKAGSVVKAIGRSPAVSAVARGASRGASRIGGTLKSGLRGITKRIRGATKSKKPVNPVIELHDIPTNRFVSPKLQAKYEAMQANMAKERAAAAKAPKAKPPLRYSKEVQGMDPETLARLQEMQAKERWYRNLTGKHSGAEYVNTFNF